MSRAPALHASGLTIGYRSRRSRCAVLADLDLRVEPGEIVCLIGPNGIGKSTLLRTLAAMQPALEGTIEVDGCDIRQTNRLALARRLAVVLTDGLAIGSLPARRVVELGRYPYSGWLGTLDARDRNVVDWAIDAVGAGHLAARDVTTLSDGERQRIMIARALAQEPVVMLLDEPTAFLDVPSRVDVMALLRRLAHDNGVAVVVSTHELGLAMETADTIWLVTADHRMRIGPPSTLADEGGEERFERLVSLLRPATSVGAVRENAR